MLFNVAYRAGIYFGGETAVLFLSDPDIPTTTNYTAPATPPQHNTAIMSMSFSSEENMSMVDLFGEHEHKLSEQHLHAITDRCDHGARAQDGS